MILINILPINLKPIISKMYRVSFVFVILISLCACNSGHGSIEAEVKSLSTTAQQKVFLEAIYDLDQKVRADETKALREYGYESDQHKQAMANIMKTDQENLEKIELYLQMYGHPNIAQHGKHASAAPWLVIHHSSGATDARRRYFTYLHEAWKRGDLDGGQFAFYLNRFYQKEFGARLQIEGPFTEEFEIDTLITLLKLPLE
jgi:hypothetical protein